MNEHFKRIEHNYINDENERETTILLAYLRNGKFRVNAFDSLWHATKAIGFLETLYIINERTVQDSREYNCRQD